MNANLLKIFQFLALFSPALVEARCLVSSPPCNVPASSVTSISARSEFADPSPSGFTTIGRLEDNNEDTPTPSDSASIALHTFLPKSLNDAEEDDPAGYGRKCITARRAVSKGVQRREDNLACFATSSHPLEARDASDDSAPDSLIPTSSFIAEMGQFPGIPHFILDPTTSDGALPTATPVPSNTNIASGTEIPFETPIPAESYSPFETPIPAEPSATPAGPRKVDQSSPRWALDIIVEEYTPKQQQKGGPNALMYWVKFFVTPYGKAVGCDPHFQVQWTRNRTADQMHTPYNIGGTMDVTLNGYSECQWKNAGVPEVDNAPNMVNVGQVWCDGVTIPCSSDPLSMYQLPACGNLQRTPLSTCPFP